LPTTWSSGVVGKRPVSLGVANDQRPSSINVKTEETATGVMASVGNRSIRGGLDQRAITVPAEQRRRVEAVAQHLLEQLQPFAHDRRVDCASVVIRFGREALVSQQLDRGAPIPPALHEHIENLASWSTARHRHRCSPWIRTTISSSASIARLWTAPPQTTSDHRTEFEHPALHLSPMRCRAHV
jgi:hypothetical protein